MTIQLNINGRLQPINAQPTDSLLRALRGAGYFSVHYGSDDGQTGVAAVLINGRLTTINLRPHLKRHNEISAAMIRDE